LNEPVGDPNPATSPSTTSEPFLTGPPQQAGPVVVQASFHLRDINDINDEAETFEFAGVLTLTWHDERQAFDPSEVGVDEKVYLGAFQFNEVFTGWFPQVILVNESGLYEKHGVVLRVQPDGTLTLIETLDAAAEAELSLRRYPFDAQRLDAIFEVLGFDRSEVVLQPESEAQSLADESIRVPQWVLEGIHTSTRDRQAPYAGSAGVASAFVVSMDVRRESFFMVRLVIFPLMLIVMLSWSVFWMDRSSLGDRINVSFIGIRGERDLAPYFLCDPDERGFEPQLLHHVRNGRDQPRGRRARSAGKGGGRRSRRSTLPMDLSSHLFWAHGAHVRSRVRLLLVLTNDPPFLAGLGLPSAANAISDVTSRNVLRWLFESERRCCRPWA
jgi:hypothetical protein